MPHRPPAVYASNRTPITLQGTIRNARSDLEAIGRLPLDTQFWLRNIMWRVRRWWAATDPTPRPLINGGELVPIQLWSEADEIQRTKQWVDSRFSAFWLCPSGPMEGIEHINTIEALKLEHGPLWMDCVYAIADIAQLSAALPGPTPKQIGGSRASVFEKGDKLASLLDQLNETVEDSKRRQAERLDTAKREADLASKFAKKYGNILQGEPGVGKSYHVNTKEAFIIVDNKSNKVLAETSTMELANAEMNRLLAEMAAKKPKPQKPKQMIVYDQFARVYNDLLGGEAFDEFMADGDFECGDIG